MSSSTIERMTVYFDDEIKVHRDTINSYNLHVMAYFASVPQTIAWLVHIQLHAGTSSYRKSGLNWHGLIHLY